MEGSVATYHNHGMLLGPAAMRHRVFAPTGYHESVCACVGSQAQEQSHNRSVLLAMSEDHFSRGSRCKDAVEGAKGRLATSLWTQTHIHAHKHTHMFTHEYDVIGDRQKRTCRQCSVPRIY